MGIAILALADKGFPSGVVVTSEAVHRVEGPWRWRVRGCSSRRSSEDAAVGLEPIPRL